MQAMDIYGNEMKKKTQKSPLAFCLPLHPLYPRRFGCKGDVSDNTFRASECPHPP
jgi:hypothetical protein